MIVLLKVGSLKSVIKLAALARGCMRRSETMFVARNSKEQAARHPAAKPVSRTLDFSFVKSGRASRGATATHASGNFYGGNQR